MSPELIQKMMRANLEPLNEQISTFPQLLKQLIQDNLAKTTSTEGSRAHRPHTGPSPNKEIGTSRASPDTGTFPVFPCQFHNFAITTITFSRYLQSEKGQTILQRYGIAFGIDTRVEIRAEIFLR